ncbi:hypothetical protein C9374_012151 [Naegleria lovaniensis]|uniref:Uncharacterized protein n=1 Tax=Naegleria lovaniensis TaxID=51637 RepID=A0AA88G8H0_NAELO|nr:uncharacterized protein C9374_012151 [Naegleria lovaniensis]KAG2373412.1 hypothetical protein C9374_012151 [Naegleria lovaniensis]
MTRRRLPGVRRSFVKKEVVDQPIVENSHHQANEEKEQQQTQQPLVKKEIPKKTSSTTTPSSNNKASKNNKEPITTAKASSSLESLLQQQHSEIISHINFAMNAYGSSLNTMKEQFMNMLNTWNESLETFRKSMISLERERMKSLELIMKHSHQIIPMATTEPATPSVSGKKRTDDQPQQQASTASNATTSQTTQSKAKQTPSKAKASQTSSQNHVTKDASTITTATTTTTSTTQTISPAVNNDVSKNATTTTQTKNAKAKTNGGATTTASTTTSTTPTPSLGSPKEIVIPSTKLFSQSHTQDKNLRVVYLRGDSSESIKQAGKIFQKLSLQNQVYALNILWNVKEEKATTRKDNDTTPIVQMRYIVLCDASAIYLYKVASRAEMQQNNIQHPIPLSLNQLLTNKKCLKVGNDILEKVTFLYHNLDELYIKPVADVGELPSKKPCTTFLELLSTELEVSTQTLTKELKWNDFSVDYSQDLSDAQAITEAKKVWLQYKIFENSFEAKKQDGENLHAYACRVLNVKV